MKRTVRLHPIPSGAPVALAEFIGAAVAGATRTALAAHCKSMPKRDVGMLVGSIRKRAVNQLVCAEGLETLRALLFAEGR